MDNGYKEEIAKLLKETDKIGSCITSFLNKNDPLGSGLEPTASDIKGFLAGE